MGQPLGKVTFDLTGPRGPDAEFRIEVPRAWLVGHTVEIQLPKFLNCAACHGGGCDRCERSGAVRVTTRAGEKENLRVVLPCRKDCTGDFLIRIPEKGGWSSTPTMGRGHLLLQVRPQELEATGALSLPAASSSIRLVECDVTDVTRTEARKQVMKQSLLVGGGLILLFLGLLYLSGLL